MDRLWKGGNEMKKLVTIIVAMVATAVVLIWSLTVMIHAPQEHHPHGQEATEVTTSLH
jgi:hypothetical protein